MPVEGEDSKKILDLRFTIDHYERLYYNGKSKTVDHEIKISHPIVSFLMIIF